MAKADWASGISGGISGATTGSTFGPLGAVGGGIIGGITGLFGGGRKKKKKKVSTMDKRQQQLNAQQHDSILGKGPLADLYNYDPEAANEVFDKTRANPAYRDWNERVIPGITGQFRNQGLMNSSYAGDALAKSGRDVQETLNAERARYLYGEQQDARSAKRNAIENLQNRTTFDYDRSAPSNSGFDVGNILKSISPEMISGVADYFKGNRQTISNSYSGPGGSYSTVRG